MQAPIVQAGNDRLARAGRHDDEVAPAVVDLPLCCEFVEDLALVAPWAHVEGGEVDRQVRRPATLSGQGLVESIPLRWVGGVVGLERRVGPVLIERCLKGVQEVPLLHGGDPDVPLEAVEHCRLRQVR